MIRLITDKEIKTMTDYLDFVDKLVASGKTTGENQSESMIHYTEMSLSRMKRWDKTGKLLQEIEEYLDSIHEKQDWIVITEAWCGDAAHAFMFIEKMADRNPLINLEWKLRDENLDLMDDNLTNGSRAIPKLIAFDRDQNKLWSWGPRPKFIQERYWELRNANTDYNEIMIELQGMYNKDKGATMQNEILVLMQETSKSKT